MMKIRSYNEFNSMTPMNMLPNKSFEPNYIIDKLWTNANDDYIFSIVTFLIILCLILL
jgi:hypothetical protein